MKSMNFIWVSGATIFLLLVVPSTDAIPAFIAAKGTATIGDTCKHLEETVAGDEMRVCTVAAHLICYKDAKAQPTTTAVPEIKIGETGQCYCPLEADKSHWNVFKLACGPVPLPVGHGENCEAPTGGCKGELTCQTGGTKGDPTKPDVSGSTWLPGSIGNCLCPDNKVHKDEGCSLAKKAQQWSEECEGDCEHPFQCRLDATPGTDGEPDEQGSNWVGGRKGKCVCPTAAHPVRKGGECVETKGTAKGHGETCGKDGCVGELKCRIGGQKAAVAGKPDNKGSDPWTAGGAEGKCVCAGDSAPVRKDDNTCGPEETTKGHGETCGTVGGCDKKFTCRVAAKKGEKGEPDEQGEREWGKGAPDDGTCVCPAGEGINKDKDCEKPGGGTDNPAPPGTSGSDRIVYQLMSTVAAAGSLLLL